MMTFHSALTMLMYMNIPVPSAHMDTVTLNMSVMSVGDLMYIKHSGHKWIS